MDSIKDLFILYCYDKQEGFYHYLTCNYFYVLLNFVLKVISSGQFLCLLSNRYQLIIPGL